MGGHKVSSGIGRVSDSGTRNLVFWEPVELDSNSKVQKPNSVYGLDSWDYSCLSFSVLCIQDGLLG